MSRSKIFLHQEDEDSLKELQEEEWLKEKNLQKFLAKYPDLMPGEQIDSENPRKWMLVSREMGVPREEGQIGWWSLDHLFLDQDGIPTFVECKQASDNRSRRKVVAQMLDYAANAIRYWNIEEIRSKASEIANTHGEKLNEKIKKLLDNDTLEESETKEFWNRVQNNLENRRIRLIFLINQASQELKRIVEFLNEEMEHTEVLIIEIKRFKQDEYSRSVLVPRVIGLTEKAKEKKKVSTKTNESEFLSKCNSASQSFFQRVLNKAKEKGYKIYWGESGFSLRTKIPENKYGTFIRGYPPNIFKVIIADWMRENDTVDEENLRNEILDFELLKKSSERVLRTEVTKNNIGDLNDLYDFFLKKIKELDQKLNTK